MEISQCIGPLICSTGGHHQTWEWPSPKKRWLHTLSTKWHWFDHASFHWPFYLGTVYLNILDYFCMATKRVQKCPKCKWLLWYIYPACVQIFDSDVFGIWFSGHETKKLIQYLYGCFLKWWYPQNTPKWSFLVGKPTSCWGNPPF